MQPAWNQHRWRDHSRSSPPVAGGKHGGSGPYAFLTSLRPSSMWRYVRSRRGRNRFATLGLLTLIFFLILRWNNVSRPGLPEGGISSAADDLKVRVSDDVMALRRRRFEKYQASEASREGPCEKGEKIILSGEDETLGKLAFETDGFNYIASDRCSLERSVFDTRVDQCKHRTYPKDLPTASVVIVYYNEYYSAILRTVHSVINRTPPEYLQEVILLDDASNKTQLGEPMQRYVRDTWPDGIVRIVRRDTRGGLVKARISGARAARGDVIVFLDAHCEANTMWAEPLLARIKEDRSVVLIPFIDAVSEVNMEYSHNIDTSERTGGFTWSLHFIGDIPLPEEERKRRTSVADPIRTPTMPGGLLAIEREFYFEMGEYDEAMEIWGGENLEMSFRIWMCGGSMEFIPCSHVGHIFRATHPYGFPSKTRDYHGINSKRLAEVWMDEYKRLFYYHRVGLPELDVGDLTDRHELRKKLNCQSFKWFLDNVVRDKFIIDEHVYGWGQIRNPVTNKCFDTFGEPEKNAIVLRMYPCQPSGVSFPEIFSLSLKNEIRRDEDTCATSNGQEGAQLIMHLCEQVGNEGQWKFKKSTGQLIHMSSGKCVDAESQKVPELRDCNNGQYQVWELEHTINETPE